MNRIANFILINPAIDRIDGYLLAAMRHSLITAAWDANGDHHFIPTRLGEHYIKAGTMHSHMEHAASGAAEDESGEPRPIPEYDHWASASPTFMRELSKN